MTTGGKHACVRNKQWSEYALRTHRRIFHAFETTELTSDAGERERWLNFVVGAGPRPAPKSPSEPWWKTFAASIHVKHAFCWSRALTGCCRPIPKRYRTRPCCASWGVEVVTNTRVSQIDEIGVLMKGPSGEQSLAAHTVLWAAGAVFGDILAERTQAERTGGVRLVVDASLALAGYPDSFVIGDLAAVTDRRAKPVPGLASAAIQQSEYVACVLKRRRQENRHRGSSTRIRGSMAVIGRAVGNLPIFTIAGFSTWLLWVVVHIYALIGNERRLRVMRQWVWKYFTCCTAIVRSPAGCPTRAGCTKPAASSVIESHWPHGDHAVSDSIPSSFILRVSVFRPHPSRRAAS